MCARHPGDGEPRLHPTCLPDEDPIGQEASTKRVDDLALGRFAGAAAGEAAIRVSLDQARHIPPGPDHHVHIIAHAGWDRCHPYPRAVRAQASRDEVGDRVGDRCDGPIVDELLPTEHFHFRWAPGPRPPARG